ncbi:hypothetical protein [Mycolicibacterium mengxianglii]|uniref:hypothetical protein n=1 Tax=Mycolicibacterium mengxianglii TaxID=2736649 RepID=UPI0018D05280|nr:hypothetical protein [Mycolicibacterium mengxianglii]
MKRLTAISVMVLTALLTAALAQPASAAAAADSGFSSFPVDPVTQLEMHVNANCVAADTRCYFDTQANLMTPTGATGFPGEFWARQTITLRSNDRNVWQEAEYSAPAGMPRETKGANHDNVLSRMLKNPSGVEISVTYFGGGPLERFRVDGSSVPTDWKTGRPNTAASFIVCSQIQVVYAGHNLTTRGACGQTSF